MTGQCDHRDCDEKSIGWFEGVDPPDLLVQYQACEDHAPEGIEPEPERPSRPGSRNGGNGE